jgi:ubiquinone/menaquinone biosynthesis C-methylase UbiE
MTDRSETSSSALDAWPGWSDRPLDAVHYGPGVPTETSLRLLGALDGKRVLELGCGDGRTAVAMAKQGARVIAVDDSSDQVGRARRLCDDEDVKVELHQSDLAELAFVRANSIDAVVCVYALAAVDDVNRVFRQVHRVLRRDAPLVFSVPHPVSLALDAADPPVWRHSYFNAGARTISGLFTALIRANFRVDTLLEPESPTGVPGTLVVRARKEGH